MILNEIKSLITEYTLCLNCLGRQFALLLSNTTNKSRGESLIHSLGMELHRKYKLTNKIPQELHHLIKLNYDPILSLKKHIPDLKSNETIDTECYICGNIFSSEYLSSIAKKIVSHASLYEFETFLVGSNTPPAIAEKEEILRSKFNIQFGEPFKSEFNRETGKIVNKLLENKEVDFKNPDVLFIVDLKLNVVTVKSNPLFISGRYRKMVRGIPQSIWHCKNCRGKGCEICDQTGRNYPDSVEEYITPYAQQVAKGSDVKLHCSGREDIDALMIGNGRPFVIEVSQPKIRTIDIGKLERRINSASNRRVEVMLTGTSDRNTIRKLKGDSSVMAKRYRMGINIENDALWDELKIKKSLEGIIKQSTPKRVLHRRADLVREKKVHEISLRMLNSNEAEIEVYCQGGLYVKELMHGDEGRTVPSLSSILNTQIQVMYLDVIEVEHNN